MATTILLITCAFFFLFCIVLVIHRRIKYKEGFRVKIGKDILFSILGGIFFPVIIYIGLKELYYRNRPRPLPKKLRKWLNKDLVVYKGKAMPLAKYNATYNKNYTLEQVYGKKYVKSLTPNNITTELVSHENNTSKNEYPDDSDPYKEYISSAF